MVYYEASIWVTWSFSGANHRKKRKKSFNLLTAKSTGCPQAQLDAGVQTMLFHFLTAFSLSWLHSQKLLLLWHSVPHQQLHPQTLWTQLMIFKGGVCRRVTNVSCFRVSLIHQGCSHRIRNSIKPADETCFDCEWTNERPWPLLEWKTDYSFKAQWAAGNKWRNLQMKTWTTVIRRKRTRAG